MSNLERSGAYRRTEAGNIDWYYGGGASAWADTATALAGVPSAVRSGKTIAIWESGKVVEYIWHTDITDDGLVKKYNDIDLTAPRFDGQKLLGVSSTASAVIPANTKFLSFMLILPDETTTYGINSVDSVTSAVGDIIDEGTTGSPGANVISNEIYFKNETTINFTITNGPVDIKLDYIINYI